MTTDMTPPDGRSGLGPDAQRLGAVGHIEEWEDLAIDLLEGTLEPQAAEPLRAHLAACASCRGAFEEQAAMATLMRSTPLVAVPPQIEAAVFEVPALAADSPATPRREGLLEGLRRFVAPRVWLPAAAMLLVAGIAISMYDRSGLDQDRDASTALVDEKATESLDRAATPESGATGPIAGEGEDTEALAVPAETTTTMAANATGVAADTLAAMRSRLDGLLASPDATGPPIAWLEMGSPSGEGAAMASLVEQATGLVPLIREAWVDGWTTYAAVLTADDLQRFAEQFGVVHSRVTAFAELSKMASGTLAETLADMGRLPLLTSAESDGWSTTVAGLNAASGQTATTAAAEDEPYALPEGMVIMVLTLAPEVPPPTE